MRKAKTTQPKSLEPEIVPVSYSSRGRWPVPAETIAGELQRIWTEKGQRLTPAAIVAEASDDTHPLHGCFEWDDSLAAEQHRLWQARMLIRSVRVQYNQHAPQNLFVHVKLHHQQQHYQQITALLERPVEYVAALGESRRKLEAAAKAFDELKNLASQEHKDDRDLALLSSIIEALATARTVASRLM